MDYILAERPRLRIPLSKAIFMYIVASTLFLPFFAVLLIFSGGENVGITRDDFPLTAFLYEVASWPKLLIAEGCDFTDLTALSELAVCNGLPALAGKPLFLGLMFIVVVWEEIIFRLPLLGAVSLDRQYGTRAISYSAVLLWSGVMFGFLHGSVLNIGVQGVGGILTSSAFLLAGGYDMKVIRPFMCVVAIHFLVNLAAFFPIIVAYD